MPIVRIKTSIRTVFNSVLFLCLLTINGYIYVNRDNGYAYVEVLNYQELYQTKEVSYISSFYYNGNDSLKVKFLEEKNKQEKIYGIKLREGKNNYIIAKDSNSTRCLPIEIGLNYASTESYQKDGRSRVSDVELFYSNTPIINYDIHNLTDWEQKSPHTTDDELIIADKILSSDIKIKTTDSSIVKIQKIAKYILKNTANNAGAPIDSMDYMSPLKQLECVVSKKSKIWCGTYTAIFSFFANRAGILTRLVCLEGKINNVLKAGHSFNEVFIKEQNKWVFVDLTSNTLCVQTPSEQYLNAIDLYNLHKLNITDMIVTTIENDSIINVNYGKLKKFYEYYFSQNNSFVFYFKNQFENQAYNFSSKIKRYLSQAPTFAIYSEASYSDNNKFYGKLFFFYLLVGFTLYLILSWGLQKIIKQKP